MFYSHQQILMSKYLFNGKCSHPNCVSHINFIFQCHHQHTNLYHKINWKYSLIFICELWYYLGFSQPLRGTYLRGRLGLTQNLLAFDIIRHPNKIQIQGVPKVVLHHYRVYLNPPITSPRSNYHSSLSVGGAKNKVLSS